MHNIKRLRVTTVWTTPGRLSWVCEKKTNECLPTSSLVYVAGEWKEHGRGGWGAGHDTTSQGPCRVFISAMVTCLAWPPVGQVHFTSRLRWAVTTPWTAFHKHAFIFFISSLRISPSRTWYGPLHYEIKLTCIYHCITVQPGLCWCLLVHNTNSVNNGASCIITALHNYTKKWNTALSNHHNL